MVSIWYIFGIFISYGIFLNGTIRRGIQVLCESVFKFQNMDFDPRISVYACSSDTILFRNTLHKHFWPEKSISDISVTYNLRLLCRNSTSIIDLECDHHGFLTQYHSISGVNC